MSSSRGEFCRLSHELEHHAYPTVAIWVEKHNRYAVWEAAMYERFLNEPVPSTIGRGKQVKRWLKKVYLRLPLRPLVRFLYAYLFASVSLTAGPAWFSARCWHFMISWHGQTCTNNASQAAASCSSPNPCHESNRPSLQRGGRASLGQQP